jgi:hypothetical protein
MDALLGRWNPGSNDSGMALSKYLAHRPIAMKTWRSFEISPVGRVAIAGIPLAPARRHAGAKRMPEVDKRDKLGEG